MKQYIYYHNLFLKNLYDKTEKLKAIQWNLNSTRYKSNLFSFYIPAFFQIYVINMHCFIIGSIINAHKQSSYSIDRFLAQKSGNIQPPEILKDYKSLTYLATFVSEQLYQILDFKKLITKSL